MEPSSKRPSFQFYPGDWLSDLKLRRCTPAARGVWMDILCALHDSDDGYGVVRWTLKELARTVGASIAHVRELVEKGVLRGSDSHVDDPLVYTPRSGRRLGAPVELIPAQPGPLWYSKRMVIDDHVRRSAGGSTRFGANQDHDAGEGQPSPPPLAPAAPHTERARLRARVLQKTSGTCYHCGVQLPARWEIDHLTPRSKGGRHTFDNLVPSCVACNQDKSDTMPDDWTSLSPSPSRRLGERESDGSSSPSSASLKEKEKHADNRSADARADTTGFEPTQAGAICRAMREAGIADVNPGHPTLLALLEAGATEAEFVGAARTAVDRQKGFAYALATLQGQREDAAKAAQGLHRGPMPAATGKPLPPWKSAQLQGAAILTGSAPPPAATPTTSDPETIDADARILPS